MKQRLKNFLGALFLKTKAFHISRYLLKNKLIILTFHNPNYNEFEKQIEFICRYYSPVTLEQVFSYYYEKARLPKNPVLITFDDGYKNLSTFIEPILKKHYIRGVVFLPTNLIGQKKIAWWDIIEYALANTKKPNIIINDEIYPVQKDNLTKLLRVYYKLLTNCEDDEKEKIIGNLLKQAEIKLPASPPEQYKFLSWEDINRCYFDYGSHTVNHPILTNIDREILKNELKKSKEIIEKKTGKEISSFCYPNGNFNNIVINQVKSLNYKLAFSTKPGMCNSRTDPYVLKRIGINKLDNLGIFILKLSGIFSLYNGWRERGKKIKVILATNYFYPQLGGITICIDNLNKSLLENDIDSEVYAYPNIFRRIENKISNLFLRNQTHRVLVFFYIAKGLLKVIRYRLMMKRVVVHGHSANFCAFFSYLSRFLGAKSVFTFHTDIRLGKFETMTTIKKKNFFFYEKIDRLASVSNYLKDQVIKAYSIKKPVRVIYNGINRIQPVDDIKREKNSILFVGNLIEIKDPLTFLEAIRILKNEGLIIKAKMIGIGKLEDTLKKRINDYGLNDTVKLIGRVEHEELSKMYRQSSVYVCSSIGEGLPNTVLEAILGRARVVATSVGGIPEIKFDKYDCGEMIDPQNAVKMASAIRRQLLKKPVKDIDKLLKNFDWELSARQYIYIYKDLFNKHIYTAYHDLMK